jgi:hypothetical protein
MAWLGSSAGLTNDIQVFSIETRQTPLHSLLGHFGIIDVIFHCRTVFARFRDDRVALPRKLVLQCVQGPSQNDLRWMVVWSWASVLVPAGDRGREHTGVKSGNTRSKC